MLKILFRLDDLDTIEANLVAEAANRLGVGEFQCFQLAYRAWFDADIDPQRLEEEFFGYLIHDHVPYWVRQYARAVIARDDAGELDAEDSAFHRYDHDTPPPSRSLAAIVTVAAVVVATVLFMGLMLLGYDSSLNPGGSCMFPPCPWVR